MNLNKPPISEEQNALEEYVDFLLTDRSNVTPIHRKLNLSKKIADNKLEVVNETVGEIIGLSLSRFDKESNKESNKEAIKENVKQTAEPAADVKPQENSRSTQKIIPEKTIAPSEKPVEESDSLAKSSHKEANKFIVESEQEELKKWDAILAAEKKLSTLKQEDAQRKIDLNKTEQISVNASEYQQLNQKLAAKNQYLLKQKELEMLRITSDRPAIFDEPLPLKEPDARLASVARLLSRISLATKPATQIEEKLIPDLSIAEPDLFANESVNEISQESVQATFLPRSNLKTKDMLPSVFQTLIFNVAKLPLAVPLLKLGGIVHISEKEDITPLVGTPDWFMGLVPHERGNLMVIDTEKYLMPEKINQNTTRQPYEYLIILDDSNWAIACHSVGEAKNLTLNDIRWSAKSSKRPWFGGMVVQYMSAIIEVDELINMLASNITD